jgi:NAD(P)H dehydrogenase (quinone)
MIVVTGASGNIGGLIARRLAGAGHRVRVFVRDPSRAPWIEGVEVAVGDFTTPATIFDALKPGDRLFMVSVHEDNPIRVEIHRRFIEAVTFARAGQIVYLSYLNATEDAINYHARSHAVTERIIRASGIPWTVLRPSLYMEVLHRRFDRDRVMRAPAGDGRAAWVTRTDIAAVAAAVLTEDDHYGRAYDITGPELLTMKDTAAIVSEVLGRPFVFHDETDSEACASRERVNQSKFEITARIASWQSVRAGEVAVVADTVERVTGSPPISLREYVAAHAADFP